VALQAKARAARRRRHEQRATTTQVERSADLRAEELLAVLDAELGKLPDKWRLPLILCYLEGRTQEEVAKQLAWSKSTLRRRLEEAREVLGNRLKRRGLVWSAALSAVLVSDCLGAAAPGLVASTVDAAAGMMAGNTVATAASPNVAALTEGVLQAMFWNKIKNGAMVLLLVVFTVIGGGFAFRAPAGEDQPKQPEDRTETTAREASKEQWGLTTQGLQMSISATVKERGNPEFQVAIRNVGEQDVTLNLGMMLANGKPLKGGKSLFPTNIRLNLTDPKGKRRELHFSEPGIAGRVDDYVVPLRVGSVYTLKLPLSQFWSPNTKEFTLELKPGKHQVLAQFEGSGAKHGSSKFIMNFWKGKLQSNTLTLVADPVAVPAALGGRVRAELKLPTGKLPVELELPVGKVPLQVDLPGAKAPAELELPAGKISAEDNGEEPREWANKLFQERSKEVSKPKPGEVVKHRFAMKNIYTVPLEVARVQIVNAEGATYSISNKTLQPGQAGTLEVTVDPSRIAAGENVKIHVSVGPKYTSTATLTLKVVEAAKSGPRATADQQTFPPATALLVKYPPATALLRKFPPATALLVKAKPKLNQEPSKDVPPKKGDNKGAVAPQPSANSHGAKDQRFADVTGEAGIGQSFTDVTGEAGIGQSFTDVTGEAGIGQSFTDVTGEAGIASNAQKKVLVDYDKVGFLNLFQIDYDKDGFLNLFRIDYDGLNANPKIGYSRVVLDEFSWDAIPLQAVGHSRLVVDGFSRDAIPVEATAPRKKQPEKPAPFVPFNLNVGQFYDFLMPSGKWVHDRSMVVLEPPSKNWVKVQIDSDRAGWVNLNHVVAVSPTVFTCYNQMRTTILGDMHR
jgi:hypothetical protein